MGDESTEHPEVARTGDLQHIRIEVPHQAHHFSRTMPKGNIVFVSLVERERQSTSPKLDPGYRTHSHDLVAGTCVNDQEWEPAVLRKCFKVPTGIRDPVHFVVNVREESNPQISTVSIPHDVASFTPSHGAARVTSSRRICPNARRTVAFSIIRIIEKIRSIKAGRAFHRAEIGWSTTPDRSGWKTRSSQRRQPGEYPGSSRITSSTVWVVRMPSGSAYCGIKSTWLRCSTRTSGERKR